MYTLLIGGARSGKTATAERLARASGAPVVYLATGEPGDEEMADRIARHRSDRPGGWITAEEPRDLIGAIGQLPDDVFVVVDCLTLWLANRLEASDDALLGEAVAVAGALADRPGDGAVVSNEVGSGIVPVDAATRRYRDLLGRVNGVFRADAAEAYLCVAGGVVPIGEPL